MKNAYENISESFVGNGHHFRWYGAFPLRYDVVRFVDVYAHTAAHIFSELALVARLIARLGA